MMSQSILVTGGAGYVGSHACKALARAGYRPVVYDNLSRGHREAVRWGPLVEGDLHDRDRARRGDAAHIRSPPSCISPPSPMSANRCTDPELYYATTSAARSRCSARCARLASPRIVFSSTCAVYGVPDSGADRARRRRRRRSTPTARPSWRSSGRCTGTARAYGLRYAALRYFNAAGARSRRRDRRGPRAGNPSDPAGAARRARAAATPVAIFGTDYPTPDGTAIRDYIHVADLADAHVRALDYLAARRRRAPRSISAPGSGYSVREVIAAVERIAAAPVPQREAPRRPGDPPELVADPAWRRAPRLAAAPLRPRHDHPHRARLGDARSDRTRRSRPLLADCLDRIGNALTPLCATPPMLDRRRPSTRELPR